MTSLCSANKNMSRSETQDQKNNNMHIANNDDYKEKKNDNGIVCSFEDMKLSDNLLRGISSYGWDKPSGIQQRAIIPVIEKHEIDIIAQAQSGTGKTGTFSIASLQRINPSINECQILILSPTPELVRQTYNVINALSKYMNNISCYMLIGGTTSVRDDIMALSKGVQLIVGTPERVNSMISRGILKLKALQLFILDEADQMLSRGFWEQIYKCFQYLPGDVQYALFSTTMPIEIIQLSTRFMRDPPRILIKNNELTLDGIKQFYVDIEKEENKLLALLELYEPLQIMQGIIFVNSRRKVIWLKDQMLENDIAVSCIHSDLSSKDREFIMKEFRSGKTRVLISTDLLSRGIDINTVSFVINYDLPRFKESYIHRIGRSGRYGKKGCAINFVPDQDAVKLRELETFYDTIIDELPENLKNVTD